MDIRAIRRRIGGVTIFGWQPFINLLTPPPSPVRRTPSRSPSPPPPRRFRTPPRRQGVVPAANASRVLKRMLERRARLHKNDLWNIKDIERILKRRKDDFSTLSFDSKRDQSLTGIDIAQLHEQDELWKTTQTKQDKYAAQMREAGLSYRRDLQSQHDDQKIYYKTLTECLNRGEQHPEWEKLKKCKSSLDFLDKSWNADFQLMRQRSSLLRLRALEDDLREEARHAMRMAGLDHYETEVRDLKRQVQEACEAIKETRRRQVVNLGAFYASAEFDLLELQNDGPTMSSSNAPASGQPGDASKPAPPDAAQLQEVQDAYHKSFNDMLDSRKALEQHRKTYMDQFENFLATATVETPNKPRARVEEEFTAQWVREWRSLAKNLDKLERTFMTGQNVAMRSGCELLKFDHNVFHVLGSDIPQFCESGHPDDGHVSTEGTEQKRVDKNRQSRIKPWIEDWRRGLEPTKDTRAPPIHSVPELESGSVGPWDSVSLADRHRRRRRKIDQYQAAMDEARYHKS